MLAKTLQRLIDEKRTTAVEIALQVFGSKGQPGRTAIDHTPDGRSVAFPEAGDREQLADGVAGHGPLL